MIMIDHLKIHIINDQFEIKTIEFIAEFEFQYF